MKDFFVYLLFGVFLLITITGSYILLSAMGSDHITLSSIGPWFTPFKDIYFPGWARPLIIALGAGIIALSILLLSNVPYIVRVLELITGGNLTIEDGRLCLKNSGCKVRLLWNKRIECYKRNKLLFYIDIADLTLRDYSGRVQLGLLFEIFFVLYIQLVLLEFSITSKAEDIQNYCYIFLLRYQNYLVKSIVDIVRVNANTEREKLDINNSAAEEISKLPGVNIIMSKNLIKKREELGGFKTTEDVILYLHLKPHMAEILRPLICVNKMKISKAFKRNNDRRVDI